MPGSRHRPSLAAGLLAAALAVATPAVANGELPPLREQDYIYNRLFAAAVGDEIRKACPDISPRWFRVLRGRYDLENRARDLGYTREQVEAFIESEEEQDRMRRLRDAYLERHGVVKGDSESYCDLGRAEIERNSLIGYLLREH